MTPISLEILSPTKVIARASNVSEIIIPAHWGQMGILPGYTHFVTTLNAGVLSYRENSEPKSHEIPGGLLVIKENKATVLLDEGFGDLKIN